MEKLTPALACNDGCPACCEETIEEYNARVEAGLRNRSLTLANLMAVAAFGAHCFFTYNHIDLQMPDFLWAVFLAPYGGAALGKVSGYLNKVTEKNGSDKKS